MSGELIVISPYTYYRGYGETKFNSGSDTELGVLNPALSGMPSPAWFMGQLVTIANDPSLSPKLIGTEQEASGACYHISVEITLDVSKKALNSNGQQLGAGTLNLWITQGGFQVERMEFSSGDPASGVAAYRIVFSNWNSVPAIQAPDPANMMTPVPSASASA